MQVVKTIPQPAQTSNKDEANKEPVSLIGMGGSRKRTHREMEEYSNHDYDMQQSIKAQSSDLQTPVPQIHAKQVKGNRNRNKRKYSEVEGSHNYQSNNKKQKTNQSNYQSKKIHIQQPAASNRDNNQKKNKRNKFNKMQNNSDLKSSGNSSNNYGFVPYDYSAVDFRQFQGGAGGAPSGQQVKSTFRNRVRSVICNRNLFYIFQIFRVKEEIVEEEAIINHPFLQIIKASDFDNYYSCCTSFEKKNTFLTCMCVGLHTSKICLIFVNKNTI